MVFVPSWDCLVAYPRWTAGDANSSSFFIARGSGAVTFILPDLDNGAVTVTLQGLDPQDRTTWRNVFAYDPGTSTETVITFADNQYTVIPCSAIGAGTFRLVASAAPTTAFIATVLIDRVGVI